MRITQLLLATLFLAVSSLASAADGEDTVTGGATDPDTCQLRLYVLHFVLPDASQVWSASTTPGLAGDSKGIDGIFAAGAPIVALDP